ncbi:uncharacterized protein LOC142336666 [Convolutriloba macropyga]|uniref:uncharacterized protein LOC142336666 n=1 Tax=Convolutriloba macropyga TaxID=536237 RepID=UPI003F52908A
MNFGSSGGGGSGLGSGAGPAGSQNADSIIQQTEMALQMQQVQNLLQSAGEKCIYPKCIYRPGRSLDRSEASCLTNCVDRFLDTYKIVATTYTNRLRTENASGGVRSGGAF